MKSDEIIKYTLKKLQEGLVARISKEELETCNTNPSVAIDWHTDDLLMKITKRTPVEVQKEYDETVEFQVPLTWFDHLKKDLNLPYKTKKLVRFVHFECGWKYPTIGSKLNIEEHKYALSFQLPPFGEEE